MKVLKRGVSLIASGYVLLFFSEYYFMNEEPAFRLIEALTEGGHSFVFLLEFTILYTFFSYAMLIPIKRYKVKTIWGLILAGALFGWWTEGTIIPLLYEAIPITIFWPSIGWHVLVDVFIGWYLFRKVMHQNKWYMTLFLTIGLGIFWGLWATWFWDQNTGRVLPDHFVLYTFSTSLVLIVAYWIMDHYPITTVRISKIEIILFVFASLFFLTLLSFTYGILPWLVLGPLTGLSLYALHRGEKAGNDSSLSFEGRTSWWQYPMILLIPLVASFIYNIVYLNGRRLIIGEVLPPILLGVGVIVYCLALYRNLRKHRSDG